MSANDMKEAWRCLQGWYRAVDDDLELLEVSLPGVFETILSQ